MMTRSVRDLALREVFHIEFLRWFGRAVQPERYVLKGGVNLRLFFGSFRYSEDMDLDVKQISVGRLQKVVMSILTNRSFGNVLKPFGVQAVKPPNIEKAKQTETTQRFKVHLLAGGQDLYTKVEFSRRGLLGWSLVELIPAAVLRSYRLSPLPVSHYDQGSAIFQKINALATRSTIQARDVFDLYLLSAQSDPAEMKKFSLSDSFLTKAYEHVFMVHFNQFRDSVVSYLSEEDQASYARAPVWDDIKLKTADFIHGLRQTKK